jgi:hypothetical protein
MGMYVRAFVVPAGTRDRVIRRAVSYRNHFYSCFAKEESFMSPSGGLFVPDYDNDYLVRVCSAVRYVELAKQYRADFDRDYPNEGPMYVDDLSKWLQHPRRPLDDIEVVVTPET